MCNRAKVIGSVVVALLLSCVTVPAVAAADDDERAEFLLGELRKNRERLVSGEFEAEVKYRRLVGATSREARSRVIFAESVSLLRHEESYVFQTRYNEAPGATGFASASGGRGAMNCSNP
jgi:hypothetical protein